MTCCAKIGSQNELLWRTVEHAIEKVQLTRRMEEQRQALAETERQLESIQSMRQEARKSEGLAAVGTTAIHLTHHLGNRFNNLFTLANP